MNYPITVVFYLICMALAAHLAGGIRESLTVRPVANSGLAARSTQHEKMERSWVQLMCAFQLVSVDLLVIAGILYLLAFTDYLQPAAAIAHAMAVFFALWGAVWLAQLFCLRRPNRDYFLLGHWAFWFLCSGLMFWGARSIQPWTYS